MTFAEIILWNELKQKKIFGYDFDRQRPIGEYIVDFYCKDLSLAIEVDGVSHLLEETIDHDIKRQEILENKGVSILRFEDSEILNDIENVLREIQGWILDWEEKNPEIVIDRPISKNDIIPDFQ